MSELKLEPGREYIFGGKRVQFFGQSRDGLAVCEKDGNSATQRQLFYARPDDLTNVPHELDVSLVRQRDGGMYVTRFAVSEGVVIARKKITFTEGEGL